MTRLVPVIVYLRVEGLGQTHERTLEIPRDEWDAMSPEQRREMVRLESEAFAAEYVYSGWEFADQADEDSAGYLIPEPGKAHR